MDLDQVELNCPFCIDPCGNKQCEYNQEYEMSEKEINEHNFIPKDAYIKCRVRPNKDTQEFELENRLKEEVVQESVTGSLRYNTGKVDFTHLAPKFLEAMAKVLTANEHKYPKFNYAKGQNVCTSTGSLYRHLTSFMNGEDIDPTDDCHHLAKVAVNAMITWCTLEYHIEKHPELDDRFNKILGIGDTNE